MSLRCEILAVNGTPLTGNDIVSITKSGTTDALVTCAAPHGLSGSESLEISGASNSSYNTGTWLADTIVSPTKWLSAGNYQGESTGGTWVFA